METIAQPVGVQNVVVPIVEWNQMVEELEDLEDLCAYNEVKKRMEQGLEDIISIEQVVSELESQSPKCP